MNDDRNPPLSRSQILAYCVYAIPLIATTAAISSFIPPFYSQALGMPLAVVASSLVLIRVIDAVCDPFIGLAIDHSGFRQKHRPWLLIALPIYVVSVFLLFFPSPDSVGPVRLVLTGGLVYIAFTIGMVVHQAWAAALTQEPRQLSRLFGFREVAVILGVLGVFATAAIASQLHDGNIAAQAHMAGGFILVAIIIATVITWLFTPDRHDGDGAHSAAKWPVLRPFLLSRNVILLSLAILLSNSAWTAMTAMGFFVAEHLYGVSHLFSLGLVVMFLIAPVGMIGWMKLAGRVGDRAALRIAFVCLAGATLLLPVATRFGASGLFCMQVLMGLGFGSGPYLLRSITGILANAYIAQTRCEVRGAAFAMTNFFDKAGSGVGAAALFPLAWLGFNPKIALDAAGQTALLWVATLTPFICFAIAGLLIHSLRLTGDGADRARG